MAGVTEFSALVYSFGTQMKSHIGSQNLRALLIRSYEGSDTADVLLRLKENTWEAQLQAIENIEAVRLMFLGELSFEYRFLDEADEEPASRVLSAEYRSFVAA